MTRAIKTHASDFAAILGLLLLSIVVAGYILHHERFRFPFIQSTPLTLNAQFSTAQAVTPGQGQFVDVSGVPIGLISGVTLKNGMATVQMQINDRYRHLIHSDATALLRPRTGLKDMFIEIDPGAKSAPVAKPGDTIPVGNTNPDVNVDEILASLDGDTRSYLDLLVNGAGAGLAGKGGDELAQVLERFEPTHYDLARLNRAIAVRGHDLRRLVDSLARLNTALGAKQGQIIQLVDSSATVFRAFASESGNLSRAIADLPGTLSQTTATLAKVQRFAQVLGPAAANLLPAARALPAANAALTALAKPSTPIVRNEIRPFVVAARPLVRNLEPASISLATATPNLSKTFVILNRFVNMLGHNPGGAQHGYLWWLAWLGHNARTLFSLQDANGVLRPLFLEGTCSSLNQIANGLSGSALLLNLSPLIGAGGAGSSLCPPYSGAAAGSTTAAAGATAASSLTPQSPVTLLSDQRSRP